MIQLRSDQNLNLTESKYKVLYAFLHNDFRGLDRSKKPKTVSDKQFFLNNRKTVDHFLGILQSDRRLQEAIIGVKSPESYAVQRQKFVEDTGMYTLRERIVEHLPSANYTDCLRLAKRIRPRVQTPVIAKSELPEYLHPIYKSKAGKWVCVLFIDLVPKEMAPKNREDYFNNPEWNLEWEVDLEDTKARHKRREVSEEELKLLLLEFILKRSINRDYIQKGKERDWTPHELQRVSQFESEMSVDDWEIFKDLPKHLQRQQLEEEHTLTNERIEYGRLLFNDSFTEQVREYFHESDIYHEEIDGVDEIDGSKYIEIFACVEKEFWESI